MQASTQRRRTRRGLLTVLLIGFMVGVGAPGAMAVITGHPNPVYLTETGGKCYRGKATMNTTLATPQANSNVTVRTSGCGSASTVPTGWVASQAISYKSYVTCGNAIGPLNTATAAGASNSVSRDCGGGAYYTAKSGVQAYNSASGYYVFGYSTHTPGAWKA